MTHTTRTCPECSGANAPASPIEHRRDCSIEVADQAVVDEDRARLDGMDLDDDGGVAFVRPMADAERAKQALNGHAAPPTAVTYVHRLSYSPRMVARQWPDLVPQTAVE